MLIALERNNDARNSIKTNLLPEYAPQLAVITPCFQYENYRMKEWTREKYSTRKAECHICFEITL